MGITARYEWRARKYERGYSHSCRIEGIGGADARKRAFEVGELALRIDIVHLGWSKQAEGERVYRALRPSVYASVYDRDDGGVDLEIGGFGCVKDARRAGESAIRLLAGAGDIEWLGESDPVCDCDFEFIRKAEEMSADYRALPDALKEAEWGDAHGETA